MESDYEIFEIARVIHGYKLIDGDSYERSYSRRDGRPLPAGYYVATWPEGVKIRRFNEEVLFFGPFQCRGSAEAVLKKFREVLASSPVEIPDRDPIALSHGWESLASIQRSLVSEAAERVPEGQAP